MLPSCSLVANWLLPGCGIHDRNDLTQTFGCSLFAPWLRIGCPLRVPWLRIPRSTTSDPKGLVAPGAPGCPLVAHWPPPGCGLRNRNILTLNVWLPPGCALVPPWLRNLLSKCYEPKHLVAPWLLPRCTLVAHWELPGCGIHDRNILTLNVWLLPGGSLVAHWLLPGCSLATEFAIEIFWP